MPTLYLLLKKSIFYGFFLLLFSADLLAQPCDLVITLDVGTCIAASSTLPVDVVISDPNDEAKEVVVFLDGVEFPWSPVNIDDNAPVIFTCWVTPGAFHTVFVQSTDTSTCNETANFWVPACACSLEMTAVVAGPCNSGLNVPVSVMVNTVNPVGTGFNLLIDGALAAGSPFPYSASSTSITLYLPGTGTNHLLLAADIGAPACSDQVNLFIPICSPPPCLLSVIASVSGSCNSNNQVPVTVSVASVNAGSNGFNLFLDGGLAPGSPFPYIAGSSTSVMILVNGDNSSHTILAKDVGSPACADTTTIITPNCVVPCTIFDVMLGNTGPQVHIVQLLNYNFSPANITAMAGDTIRFVWVGGLLHSTTSDAFSGPNTWDSGIHGTGFSYDVVITDPGSYPYYCKTHGGPNGIGMSGIITVIGNCTGGIANVPVSFEVQNGTSAGYNVYINGQLMPGSPEVYQQTNGINTFFLSVPGDGELRALTIQDAGSSFCANTVVFTTPNCGSPCGLSIVFEQTSPCNSNQQAGYTLTVTATSQGNHGFRVFLDGELYTGSPFLYAASSSTVVSLLVTGDNVNHILSVQDVDSTNCTAMLSFLAPLCTNGPCNTSSLLTTIGAHRMFMVAVDDNFFAPATHEVVAGDTIRFVWAGQHLHTVTSDTLSGQDAFNSGLHGTGYVYDIVLTQSGEHPYYCIPHGSPGGIGMSGTIIVAAPCAAGLLPVGVDFTNENGSPAGYMIMLDGNPLPESPFNYAVTGNNHQIFNVPGDGNVHQIIVMDLANPSCMALTAVSMPDCDNPCFGFSADAVFVINQFALSVDFSVPSQASNTTYTWNFGDGSSGTGASVTHLFPMAGEYTACLIAQNASGCIDSSCYPIVLVQARCEAGYEWANEGLSVTFTDHSDASVPITLYQWDFGDNSASPEQHPTHTFATVGIYNVCLTITADTCIETYCSALDLSDPCLVLSAQYSYNTVGNPLELQFTDLTTGTPDQWLWGFGDGQTSFIQNPLHTYLLAGTYHVCLIAGNSMTACYAPVFCQSVGIGVNGVNEPSLEHLLTLYPNPLSNQQREYLVTGILEKDFEKPIQVLFTDLQGRILTDFWVQGAEAIRIPWNAGIPSGFYFIRMVSENAVYTGKLSIH